MIEEVEVADSGTTDSKAVEPVDKVRTVKIVVLVLGALLTLAVVRITLVAPFDSAVTRFGCMNHATYLTDVGLSDNPKIDDRHDALVIELVEDGTSWDVRRHIRSNKLGLINRDSGACILNNSSAGVGEIEIPMAIASHGNFYTFGKLLGIILQLGLVSGFIRWFHYRFMS